MRLNRGRFQFRHSVERWGSSLRLAGALQRRRSAIVDDCRDGAWLAAEGHRQRPRPPTNLQEPSIHMSKDRSKDTGASWRVNQVVMPAAKIIEHLSAHVVGAESIRASMEGCETATAHKPERVSQQTRFLQVLATVPDGRATTGLALKQIRNLIEPEFTKRRWRLPSTDTIARALGRRRRG